MRCLVIKVSAFLLIIPTVVFAGWQVATPETSIPKEPFFQAAQPNLMPGAGFQNQTTFASAYGSSAFPNQFDSLGKPAEVYAISVSGSLKENIERIMDRYHWKVIWNAPYDYNFDGRITGTSLPNVVEKLLKPFPLQAELFMANRTMTIVPRKV